MSSPRSVKLSRTRFNETGGFHELDSYYEISRERYYLTLRYLAEIDLPSPARVLDVGGGQFAILASKLFGDEATIGDISDAFRAPADEAGAHFQVCNLLEDDPPSFRGAFDLVVLAEVVEHMPMPPYVILSKVRKWLRPEGALLITTPNLFRLRNIIRMVRAETHSTGSCYREQTWVWAIKPNIRPTILPGNWRRRVSSSNALSMINWARPDFHAVLD